MNKITGNQLAVRLEIGGETNTYTVEIRDPSSDAFKLYLNCKETDLFLKRLKPYPRHNSDTPIEHINGVYAALGEAGINHEKIVGYYRDLLKGDDIDDLVWEGIQYVVTRSVGTSFIDCFVNESLRENFTRGIPKYIDQYIDMMSQIHRQGVSHFKPRPDNVTVYDDKVYLIDFNRAFVTKNIDWDSCDFENINSFYHIFGLDYSGMVQTLYFLLRVMDPKRDFNWIRENILGGLQRTVSQYPCTQENKNKMLQFCDEEILPVTREYFVDDIPFKGEIRDLRFYL